MSAERRSTSGPKQTATKQLSHEIKPQSSLNEERGLRSLQADTSTPLLGEHLGRRAELVELVAGEAEAPLSLKVALKLLIKIFWEKIRPELVIESELRVAGLEREEA